MYHAYIIMGMIVINGEQSGKSSRRKSKFSFRYVECKYLGEVRVQTIIGRFYEAFIKYQHRAEYFTGFDSSFTVTRVLGIISSAFYREGSSGIERLKKWQEIMKLLTGGARL